MPNRILRDWTDSLRLDGMSAEAERLFVRLIMKADDYGRFHADPRLVKSGCFPLSEHLRVNDLVRWLDELSHRQLILRYEVGTRSILTIRNFGQRLKQSKAKFPPPPGKPPDFLLTDDRFPALPGTSGNFPSEPEPEPYSESETETDSGRGSPPRARAHGAPWPTLAECLGVADLRGVPKGCAEKWWNEHDARGGLDKHGQPLSRWESSLLAYATSWRANDQRDRQRHRVDGRQRGVPEPRQVVEDIEMPIFFDPSAITPKP